MRLLFVAPELQREFGWGRYSRQLMQALIELGTEVTCVTSVDNDESALHGLVSLHPIMPSLVQMPRGLTLRTLLTLPALRRLVAQADAQAVHISAEPYLAAGSLAAGGRPVFVTAHGTYLPQLLQRRGTGWLYRRATRAGTVVAVSHYTAGRVRAVLPDASIRVVHSGVDVTRFRDLPAGDLPAGDTATDITATDITATDITATDRTMTDRTMTGSPSTGDTGAGLIHTGRPTVLSVGAYKARKGYHILIEAMAQVRQQVPDAQCILIGDDSDAGYVARLHSLIAQHGLADTVHLLGRVDDVMLLRWYHAADVFAVASLNVGDRFEGFGLVHLEAMAAGLPAIGTRGCGAEEAIVDGEDGYLIDQNDPTALADRIMRLLHDDALRQRMGRAGRRKTETMTWHSVARTMLSLYGEE